VARHHRAIGAFHGRVGALGSTTSWLGAGVFGGLVRASTDRTRHRVCTAWGWVAVLLTVLALGGGRDGDVLLNLAGFVEEIDVRDSEGFEGVVARDCYNHGGKGLVLSGIRCGEPARDLGQGDVR
jgi:hypothetical protein